MTKRRDLIPTPIVNKNGVATTVHRKPSTPPASRNALPPATLTQPSVTDRERSIQIIRNVGQSFDSATVSVAIEKATDTELKLLADAVEYDPKHFKPILVRDGGANARFTMAPAIAVIYDKSLFNDNSSSSYRQSLLRNALIVADKVVNNYRMLKPSDDIWKLYNEEPEVQARVKRLCMIWATVYKVTREHPDKEFLFRALDDDRDDYEATLDILRAAPDATVAQVDHMLSGGERSLSSGVL